MKLSVIVCTYNRAHAIIPCLDSIAASLVHAAPVDAEIVVVDNASTDNTSAIVKEWAKLCAFPVQVLFEPRAGKSRACNHAIRASRGDLLVWTDDDCRLDVNHISTALRYDAADTELVLRGGRVELGDPADLPLSIKTENNVQRWHKEKHPQKNMELSGALFGANIIMRRAMVEKVGFFDERFGPATSLRAGEDTDFIFRTYLAGITIEYVPDMIVYHHHGRKSPLDGGNLTRNYIIADGGLYMKYLFKSVKPWHPRRQDIENAAREIIYGKSYWKPEFGLYVRDMLIFWYTGAARYLAVSMKKPA